MDDEQGWHFQPDGRGSEQGGEREREREREREIGRRQRDRGHQRASRELGTSVPKASPPARSEHARPALDPLLAASGRGRNRTHDLVRQPQSYQETSRVCAPPSRVPVRRAGTGQGMKSQRVYVGCATWAVGAANDHLLPRVPGGNLARYAARLTAAEVNSSFHREHRPSTWGRWARSLGPSFRFSVKLPKSITHERRLVDVEALLDAFAEGAHLLGEKLVVVLVQLPPSLAFDADTFDAFHKRLAERVPVAAALEPRHPSWFDEGVDAFLAERHVARVGADPAVVPAAAERPVGQGCVTSVSTGRLSRTAHPTRENFFAHWRRGLIPATGASSTTPRPAPRCRMQSSC